MHYALHHCNLAASKRRVLAVVHDRFSVDLRCIFGESFLSGSSKVAEYARPSCVSVVFTPSELQGRRKRSGWSGFGRTNILPKSGRVQLVAVRIRDG